VSCSRSARAGARRRRRSWACPITLIPRCGEVHPPAIDPEGGQGTGTQTLVENISPYLLDTPSVLVRSHDRPVSGLPEIMFGRVPSTWSWSRPRTQRRWPTRSLQSTCAPYMGTDERVKGKQRWCLWLETVTMAKIAASPFLADRVERTCLDRLDSRAASTRGMASTAPLFAQRTQPAGPVLIIPRVVSGLRDYLTAAYSDGSTIASDSVFCGSDRDGLAFAVSSSSMFMAWMRGVGGRLKSDQRFSKTFTGSSQLRVLGGL